MAFNAHSPPGSHVASLEVRLAARRRGPIDLDQEPQARSILRPRSMQAREFEVCRGILQAGIDFGVNARLFRRGTTLPGYGQPRGRDTDGRGV